VEARVNSTRHDIARAYPFDYLTEGDALDSAVPRWRVLRTSHEVDVDAWRVRLEAVEAAGGSVSGWARAYLGNFTTAASESETFQVPPGTNAVLLVFAGRSTFGQPTSVSYGGKSLSLLDSHSYSWFGSCDGAGYVFLYTGSDVPAGSNSASWTAPSTNSGLGGYHVAAYACRTVGTLQKGTAVTSQTPGSMSSMGLAMTTSSYAGRGLYYGSGTGFAHGSALSNTTFEVEEINEAYLALENVTDTGLRTIGRSTTGTNWKGFIRALPLYDDGS